MEVSYIRQCYVSKYLAYMASDEAGINECRIYINRCTENLVFRTYWSIVTLNFHQTQIQADKMLRKSLFSKMLFRDKLQNSLTTFILKRFRVKYNTKITILLFLCCEVICICRKRLPIYAERFRCCDHLGKEEENILSDPRIKWLEAGVLKVSCIRFCYNKPVEVVLINGFIKQKIVHFVNLKHR